MVSAADGRPLIEMGSRRTHEQAAVAAARAAYIAGFAGIVEPRGAAPLRRARAGHQRARVHAAAHHGRRARTSRPRSAAQVDALGVGTTLLVDTYDITAGRGQRRSRSPAPSWARCASTPATSACWPARCATSSTAWARPSTRIVVSGDLDEFAIAALRAEPVDTYGVGTSVVTGSGAPTAGMVYKLVEVDGMPVREAQQPQGIPRRPQGRRLRLAKPSGTIVEEVVHPAGAAAADDDRARAAALTVAAGARRASRSPTSIWTRPASAWSRRAAQPAVGRPEALPAASRRSRPAWSRRCADGEQLTTVPPVTELLATAVAALGGSRAHRPGRDGRGGRARLRHRRAPGGAGRHRHRQVAGLPGAGDRAGRRPTSPVVVSTATIALQRQLVDRDLPRLADALAGALPRRPELRAAQGSRKLPVPEQDSQRRAERAPTTGRRRSCSTPVAATALGRDVQRLTEWASDTETGDRDELTPGVPDRSWSPGQRVGAGMPRRGPLPVRHRLLRREGPRQGRPTPTSSSPTTRCWPSTRSPRPSVLPEHDLLVVDEAHELVDRVTVGGHRRAVRRPSLGVALRRVARLVEPGAEPAAGGGGGDVLLGDPRRRARAASTTSTTSWPPT